MFRKLSVKSRFAHGASQKTDPYQRLSNTRTLDSRPGTTELELEIDIALSAGGQAKATPLLSDRSIDLA